MIIFSHGCALTGDVKLSQYSLLKKDRESKTVKVLYRYRKPGCINLRITSDTNKGSKFGSGFNDWIKLDKNDSTFQILDQFNLLDGQFRPSHSGKSTNILKIAAIVASLRTGAAPWHSIL